MEQENFSRNPVKESKATLFEVLNRPLYHHLPTNYKRLHLRQCRWFCQTWSPPFGAL